MLKKVLFFFLFFLLATSYKLQAVSAFDRPTFITLVNPVRGRESWVLEKQTPLDLPIFQYQNATPSAMPITWLLRFDAVNDSTISAFFATISATDSSQVLGAFLEITPKLTEKAAVVYPPGEYMSAANRIFLSGYTQEERIKLIDTYMFDFKEKFGHYPLAVGAWHIDSYSLAYLRNRYSVLAAVICDEQYTTDNYRLWGGYLGSPYLPNKFNPLIPADSPQNMVDIAVTKWAARDPFNFYGAGRESIYSFQVNDYMAAGFDHIYFEKLLSLYARKDFNEFSQIVIGLENDYELKSYAEEIKKVYASLNKNKINYDLKFVSLNDFGTWFINRYKLTSPTYFYQTEDITGKNPGKVYWYQNPFYRIGLKSDGGKTIILDFRIYNQSDAEEYYLIRNINRKLYAETNPIIDSVKYPGTQAELPLDLNKAKISFNNWRVIFDVEGKVFKLEPRQLVFIGITPPTLNTEEIKINKTKETTFWDVAPKLPFTTTKSRYLIAGLSLLGLLIFLLTRLKKIDRRLAFIFLIGIVAGFIATLTMLRSGKVFLFGLGFWGPNGHDAFFHLSISEHFKQSLLNLSHPQLAGTLLKNYHFAYDWLSGLFGRLFDVAQTNLYFRYFPLAMVILISFVLVKLLSSWKFSKVTTAISLFLIFLTGSFGFIPRFLTGGTIFSGESAFWANQSVSIFLNPPFALSVLILLVYLFLFEKFQKKFEFKHLLMLALLGGSLAQIKIYAFIILCLSLLLSRQIRLLIATGLAGLILLLPSLSLNGTPFIFSPLWFTRSLFEAHDRVIWPKMAQAWQTYETIGALTKLLLVNLVGLAVFVIGNLGIRVIGLINILPLRHPGRTSSKSENLAKLIVLIGLVLPLLFIQRVNPWNTIQFIYYTLFFLGIFTAKQITNWLTNSKYKILNTIFYVLIALLILPTTIGTLRDYITPLSATRVSLVELRGLDLLRRSPKGVVISPFYDESISRNFPDPRPLYAYVSTAYISALSGQPEYLSDTINLDITGFDYKEQVKNSQRLYLTRDPMWVKEFLQRNDIVYVYESPMGRLKIHPEEACLTRIFDSGEVNIYKYGCNEQTKD